MFRVIRLGEHAATFTSRSEGKVQRKHPEQSFGVKDDECMGAGQQDTYHAEETQQLQNERKSGFCE